MAGSVRHNRTIFFLCLLMGLTTSAYAPPPAPKLATLSETNNDVDISIFVAFLSENEEFDPSEKSIDEWFLAALSGSCVAVKALFNKWTDINRRTPDGETALYIASEYGHKDLVQLLLDRGADASLATKAGGGALSIAVQNKHIDIVRILLENDTSTISIKEKDLALCIASESNGEDIVKLLFEYKRADADFTLDGKQMALYAAAQNGHAGTVNILLKHDVAPTTGEYNAVYIASLRGHTDVVRLLLKYGADANFALPKEGWTALHAASEKGHVSTVKLLLERGADASKTTKSGFTPLKLAIREEKRKVAQVLETHLNSANYSMSVSAPAALLLKSRQNPEKILQKNIRRSSNEAVQRSFSLSDEKGIQMPVSSSNTPPK